MVFGLRAVPPSRRISTGIGECYVQGAVLVGFDTRSVEALMMPCCVTYLAHTPVRGA